MTTTVDAGIASGTDSVLGYLDDQTGYSLQIGLSNKTGSGIAISGKDLQVGGAWGTECQVKITLNDGISLAGEFTCPRVQGAGAPGAKPLNLALAGTFTAK